MSRTANEPHPAGKSHGARERARAKCRLSQHRSPTTRKANDLGYRHQQLLALYPAPKDAGALPVRGRYLDPEREPLNTAAARAPEQPLIYGNFVTSLDGRIALGATPEQAHVPRSLTTAADWRLFQELQAHADCFITHGGYLRALAAGRLNDILQVGLRSDGADLLPWRQAQGLNGQPAVVVVSQSLDFVLPPSLSEHEQSVLVVTSRDAPREKVQRLRDSGIAVSVTSTGGQVGARATVEAVRAWVADVLIWRQGPRC